MKVKGDGEMRGYKAFRYGGYEVEYYEYGGCYPGHYTSVGYATKAYALQGIEEFHGVCLKVWECPGNCMPRKEIAIADLEEPVIEKKKKKKKKKKKEIGWIQE